eukprot:gb/GEZN01028868.1/.p1 GENE.gb/GEZN01028868.1/~~gb/GEZN01028868.1/.p1  ORF type:complete len:124 (-),score=7.96 gb/GEZN01028868.1/:52-423(-)
MSLLRLLNTRVVVSRPVFLAHTLRPSLVAYRSFSEVVRDSFLDRNEVTSRVLEVVKNFEGLKNVDKLSSESKFSDLGLDSLDAVEVVMAFEDEFLMDIPDAEAEKIQSIPEAIDYISAHPNAQ